MADTTPPAMSESGLTDCGAKPKTSRVLTLLRQAGEAYEQEVAMLTQKAGAISPEDGTFHQL